MNHITLKTTTLILTIVFAFAAGNANAQTEDPQNVVFTLDDFLSEQPVDSIPLPEFLEPKFVTDTISTVLFLPPVFQGYAMLDNEPFKQELSGDPWMEWIERSKAASNNAQAAIQAFMINHPEMVHNNIAFMQEPPRRFYGTVNPSEHRIEIKEVGVQAPDSMQVKVKKRHWIRNFAASLQFSQAYISPNWYQGGNNNLNFLANILYNVKLNQAFHPNLLFETTISYKLGINSAPDDSLRNYSISEDLLQVNSTFGIKAARHWYYSITGQFKTQLLNSYVVNTYNMASAFLAPGELNLGLGMTYNYAAPKGNFTFDASISPLSYNLKVCIKPDNVIPHSTFDIDPDRKTKSEIGSSFEIKLGWKITSNITFNSRVFFFTDYKNLTADWENTLAMSINKYLTTQIYVHARYDTSTPPVEDRNWHKLQLKEILSFGVAYKFSTI